MNYQARRKAMVQEQLESRGIADKAVLNAFLKIERHKFVPEELAEEAYADYPLPIGEKQTISQPYMAALMTELLALTGKEKVLEIGVGSGYQTAVLAELSKEVFAIEWFPELRKTAEDKLKGLGYTNVHVKLGDGREGWPEEAPFDRVMAAAAAESIPKPLTDQLAEGGILVMPLGGIFSQVLTVAKKIEGEVQLFESILCVFVPLL